MGSQRLRHPARLAGASLMRLQSDERLAELAVDGHEAAFAAIVDRYRGPLLRYSAGIVGAGRAEDAVQQAFINAHDALQRTSDVRHLRSWLYRIAHNASLNVLRAVRDDVALDPTHAAAADGPAEAFERTERLRATLAAVADLPERQRAALVLRELEGRSHEEIAAALGVTKGSARQHLMRARSAVRATVTAVTPYPLIAKLASLATGPGVGASWSDAATGAGAAAGAGVLKLTAGMMATSALVGGAVGTAHVVHHRHHAAAAAEVRATHAPQPPSATTPAPAENTALLAPATPTHSPSLHDAASRDDDHGDDGKHPGKHDPSNADDDGHHDGAPSAPSGKGNEGSSTTDAAQRGDGNDADADDKRHGDPSPGDGTSGKGPSDKGSDGQGPSGKTTDGKSSDGKGPSDKTTGDESTSGKNPDDKSGSGNSSDDTGGRGKSTTSNSSDDKSGNGTSTSGSSASGTTTSSNSKSGSGDSAGADSGSGKTVINGDNLPSDTDATTPADTNTSSERHGANAPSGAMQPPPLPAITGDTPASPSPAGDSAASPSGSG